MAAAWLLAVLREMNRWAAICARVRGVGGRSRIRTSAGVSAIMGVTSDSDRPAATRYRPCAQSSPAGRHGTRALPHRGANAVARARVPGYTTSMAPQQDGSTLGGGSVPADVIDLIEWGRDACKRAADV